MKKTIIPVLAFLSIATTTVKAQSTTTTKSTMTRPTIGIFGGVNFQNITGKDISGNDIEDNKLATLFHGGINVEIPIAPEFYLQPGVTFNMKGTKIKDGDNTTKVNISYLDVPVNFVYKPELGAGKLILGVGPYIGFALGGKVKNDDGDSDIKIKNKVTTAEYLADGLLVIRKIDAGGNLMAGYEFSNKISLVLNAQLGMVKLNPTVTDLPSGTNDESNLKNVGFGVSLGYRF